MKPKRRYTVSDGKLVLHLQPAEEGGYIVTSPLDPELITEAETLEEAFVNASDAAKALPSPPWRTDPLHAPADHSGELIAIVENDPTPTCAAQDFCTAN